MALPLKSLGKAFFLVSLLFRFPGLPGKPKFKRSFKIGIRVSLLLLLFFPFILKYGPQKTLRVGSFRACMSIYSQNKRPRGL